MAVKKGAKSKRVPKKGSIKKGASQRKRLKAKRPSARAKKSRANERGKKARFNITQDDKNISRFMLLAIDTEKQGIKFYTAAKKKANDYNMSKLLEVIIEQEKKHLAAFTAIHDAEKKGIKEAAGKAGEYRTQSPLKSPLFKPVRKTKKLTSIHELFKEALDFEVRGHDMYLYMARRIKDRKIKEFLKMVAHEELNHRNFIHQHQDALYDTGYWLGLEHVRLET